MFAIRVLMLCHPFFGDKPNGMVETVLRFVVEFALLFSLLVFEMCIIEWSESRACKSFIYNASIYDHLNVYFIV